MSTRGERGNAYLIFGHKEMQYSFWSPEMALREVSVAEARIKAGDMLSLYTTARVKPVLRRFSAATQAQDAELSVSAWSSA